MRYISANDINNIIKELAEDRTLDKTLEDILEELKMYGQITIKYIDNNWHCEYIFKIKTKEYKFNNYGKDLLQLVKSCLMMVYLFQAKTTL